MDHQIQHDIDIQAPRSEHTHSVDFKEERKCHGTAKLFYCRIESLKMPHREDAAHLFCGVQQSLGGLKVGSNRLFYQDIQSCFQQLAANLRVVAGGNSD